VVRAWGERFWLFALGCALVASRSVAAQTTGPGGLTPGTFNVDLVNGPIVGPSRVVSLGGAYTALGYGIDNAIITPAAYAARTLWDTRWFEWDVTVDYSPGVLLRQVDFINNGKSLLGTNTDLLFVTLGASATVGNLGFGAIVRMQDYHIGNTARLEQLLANYGLCYAFLQGQLLVGVGARTVSLTLSNLARNETLGTFTHSGPEAGFILGLADMPYRIGLTVRTGVKAKSDQDSGELPFSSPKAVVLPPELQLGVAYQFGNRPLNRRWINPHDRERDLRNEMLVRRLQRQRTQAEREAAAEGGSAARAFPAWLREPHDPEFWRNEGERMAREEAELQADIARAEQRHLEYLRALSRKYILVSADMLAIGATADGVGLESFLSQVRQESGKNASLSFRVGVEGEPIPDRLRLRVGSYLEPSRFMGVRPRLHATMGGDLKLFAFDVFGLVDKFDIRVTATLDVAERYRNFGVSVGIWR
jgi:hypothetical protein